MKSTAARGSAATPACEDANGGNPSGRDAEPATGARRVGDMRRHRFGRVGPVAPRAPSTCATPARSMQPTSPRVPPALDQLPAAHRDLMPFALNDGWRGEMLLEAAEAATAGLGAGGDPTRADAPAPIALLAVGRAFDDACSRLEWHRGVVRADRGD
jgi:hypothetical protein